MFMQKILNNKQKLKNAEDRLEEYDIGHLIQLEKYRIKDSQMYPTRMFNERLAKLFHK